MKKSILVTLFLLGFSTLFVTQDFVSANSLSQNTTEVRGLNLIETTIYTESNLIDSYLENNSLTLVFNDDSTVSFDNRNFDISNFEIKVEESYNLITPFAGGAINFPNTINVSSSGFGTSSFPPQTKVVSATRNKAYQERVYVATYKGSIPLNGIQSSTRGGKIYTYQGNIPYISHKIK